MASKIQVSLVDDIDNTEADETVTFGLDGVSYEIDLSKTHALELRGGMSLYVEHARKVKAGVPVKPSRQSRSTALNLAEIREWAKSEGYEVKDRGRVPNEIIAKYEAMQR